MPAIFFLLTLSAHAQQGVPTSDWERVHDGLKAAHPMPGPAGTLQSDSFTASGNLIQGDVKTHETVELRANAGNAALSTAARIAGHPGIAPQSAEGQLEAPIQQQSPEVSDLVGTARGWTRNGITAPQPHLTPYGFPFSTQLRLLTRFHVDGVDYFYTCSASQASDFHLLTAAHCIYDHDPKGDGSGVGAGFATEVWAWAAGTDVVDPIDSDNWPDFPYGIAKVSYESAYSSWINNSDLNWDVAFLTLDRPLGEHVGWMGREWGTIGNLLNFGGYPSEAPYVLASNPHQYVGYSAPDGLGSRCCRLPMNALVYGGQAGGGVWRVDPADGSRYIEGINSNTDSSGHAEATLLRSQIEADLASLLVRDAAIHAPPDLAEVIEYVQDDRSKSLIDTSVDPGASFHLKLNAFNAGYASAGEVTASVYLTKNLDNVASGVFVQDLDLGELDAYSYTVQTHDVVVPATVAPGRYYVGYLLSAAKPQYGEDRKDIVLGRQSLTVTNGSPVLASFTVNPSHVLGGQSATGTLTLTAPAPAGGVTIDLSTTYPNMVHLPASVLIPEKALSAQFTITTSSERCVADAVITASGAGPDLTAHFDVYETPSAPLSLTFSPNPVYGGNKMTGTVTLVSPAPYGGEEIELQSSLSVVQVPATIHFNFGQVVATFAAETAPVDQTATDAVKALDQLARSIIAIANVLPASLFKVTVTPASVVGGEESTGTVELTGKAPVGGAKITLAIGKPDGGVTLPDGATVTVKAGESTATFPIKTVAVKQDIKVQITGTYRGNSKSTSLHVAAKLEVVSLTIKPGTIAGGAPNMTTGTVTLNAVAPADTKINLMSGDVKLATVPDSVTVRAGAQSGTFPIMAVNAVTEKKTVTITGTLGGQKPVPGNFDVVPVIPISVTIPSPEAVAGNVLTATVTLNGLAPGKMGGTITLTSASSNADAAKVNGKLRIDVGSNSGTFLILLGNVQTVMTSTITVSYNGVSVNLMITVTPVELTNFTIAPTEIIGGKVASGGKAATATITLSAKPPAKAVVMLTAEKGAPIQINPDSVAIETGKSGTAMITADAVAKDTQVKITATYGGFVKTAAITILAPMLNSVTAPATVKGDGKTTAQVTVTLTGPAPAGGIKVNLEAASPFPIPKGTVVTVPAGSTTAQSKAITAAKVIKNTTVNIEASSNGVTKTVAITVTKP
jgi:hypothetical protein